MRGAADGAPDGDRRRGRAHRRPRSSRSSRTTRTACSRPSTRAAPPRCERAIDAAGEACARLVAAAVGGARRRSSCAPPSCSPGPWRPTLNAATMLGQSKTAHQAEIDAACELIDFLRFNVEFMRGSTTEQPISSPGVWNRLEYRPLEGFVFAVTPFNFTAIGGNLPTRAALMGNTVVWKPASTAAYSALLRHAAARRRPGCPTASSTSSTAPGAAIGDPALASPRPRRRALHRLDAASSTRCGGRSATNIDRYKNYPRIVGETGGKDFILAHPSADVEARRDRDRPRRLRVPGPEVLGRVARLRAVEPLAGAARAARRARSPQIRMGDVADFSQLHGRGHRREAFAEGHREAIELGAAAPSTEIVVGGGADDSEGCFVEPTVIETTDPDLPLMREELFGPIVTPTSTPRASGSETLELVDRGSPVRAHRRRLRATTATRSSQARGGAALRGRQLLRQRQADRRGRRPAAVRRRARLGHERQGRLDVEPDPLGQPADDQGDVRARRRDYRYPFMAADQPDAGGNGSAPPDRP